MSEKFKKFRLTYSVIVEFKRPINRDKALELEENLETAFEGVLYDYYDGNAYMADLTLEQRE